MFSALILMLIGFFLLFVEFFLPGGIIGIAGGAVIVTALILFVVESESLIASILFITATAVALVFLVKYALYKVQHTRGTFSIYSNGSQEGYYASQNLTDAVGKTVRCMTDLRPGGYVDLNGERIQALSKSGYISKGSEVVIIGTDEESLIVTIKR